MGRQVETTTCTHYTCDGCRQKSTLAGNITADCPSHWLKYEAKVAGNVNYRKYILCSFTCLVNLHMSVPSHLHALGRLLRARKYVMVEGLLPMDERDLIPKEQKGST
jgi:hypothetical protein